MGAHWSSGRLVFLGSYIDMYVKQFDQIQALQISYVGAARKFSPDWSQKTMTCHSFNCFSIVWGQG